MHNQKSTPLDPDSEQQLFEKLAMDSNELEMLNYIRHHVKIIIDQEAKIKKRFTNAKETEN